MPYTTYSLGLTLKQPTRGTKGYYSTLDADLFTKLSSHDHTGSGKGAQISTAAIIDNAVTGLKIRLANNQAFRARNAADSADLEILKVNTSNGLEIYGTEISVDSSKNLVLKHTAGYSNSGWKRRTKNVKTTDASWVNVESFPIGTNETLVVAVNGYLYRKGPTGESLTCDLASNAYAAYRVAGSPASNQGSTWVFAQDGSNDILRFNISGNFINLEASSGAILTAYHSVLYDWSYLSTEA